MLKIHPPAMSEVTFSHSIKPDDTPIRGNLMDSGDANVDRETEDAVYRQLDRGNQAAWCGLIVFAEWRGYKRQTSLWGCSYASEEKLLEDLLPDLREEAYAELCIGIEEGLAELADRIEVVDAVAPCAECGKIAHESYCSQPGSDES